MIFKLWHKLVITMIGITGVVLILALFISDQSVKKGFLAYINQVESNRLNELAENLVLGYEEDKNWDFIKDNRRVWRRYNRRFRSPGHGPARANLPRLNDLAQQGGSISPAPPITGHGPALNDDDIRRPPRRRGGGPRRRPPPTNVQLVDSSKQYLVGPTHLATPLSEPMFKPLESNGEVVAYLKFYPFTKFTDELDMQFIQYQSQALLKIALIALGVILFGAGLFATYLRFRINKIGHHAGLLTSGDFSAQNLDKSKDELGQLSLKLDTLGKTLTDNREARQRWVSDISHELRTPIAVLQGELEAMQDGIREINKESVNSLHHETIRLSRLVTDLHQLSLSDLGSLDYVREPLRLCRLVRGVLQTHQHKFEQKKVDVSLNEQTEAVMINGDQQRLEQLFTNLATNSLHYTRESGKLEVMLKQDDNEITIEWSDSEPGVTDEQLEKLFERLYKVDASRNRNEGSTGLGLSISKNIIEAHDGNIEAKHSDLGGITFSITFKK